MEPLLIMAAVAVFGALAAASLAPLQHYLDTRRRLRNALTMSKEWRQLNSID